jgi:anti-sigma B factor antagonist
VAQVRSRTGRSLREPAPVSEGNNAMTKPPAPHGTTSTLHHRPRPAVQPEHEGAAMPIVGLSTRDYGGHVVAALHGELDITGTASVTAMLTAAAAGNPRIIVDLAALEYIDCHALGALGRLRAQARQAGGDVLLAAPHGLVRRLLDLTGLISVFAVHTSVDQAVRAAGGEPDRRQHAEDR